MKKHIEITGDANMFAIAFDIEINELKKHYGEPYNNAYYEIKAEMENLGFNWTQGSLYLSNNDASFADVFKAIDTLRNIEWFKKSVRDIRAFEVKNWSEMTEIVKS